MDSIAIANIIPSILQKLSEYSSEYIYNVSESCLFFKLLPRRIYILQTSENKKPSKKNGSKR